jgi:hypothetical protein
LQILLEQLCFPFVELFLTLAQLPLSLLQRVILPGLGFIELSGVVVFSFRLEGFYLLEDFVLDCSPDVASQDLVSLPQLG